MRSNFSPVVRSTVYPGNVASGTIFPKSVQIFRSLFLIMCWTLWPFSRSLQSHFMCVSRHTYHVVLLSALALRRNSVLDAIPFTDINPYAASGLGLVASSHRSLFQETLPYFSSLPGLSSSLPPSTSYMTLSTALLRVPLILLHPGSSSFSLSCAFYLTPTPTCSSRPPLFLIPTFAVLICSF